MGGYRSNSVLWLKAKYRERANVSQGSLPEKASGCYSNHYMRYQFYESLTMLIRNLLALYEPGVACNEDWEAEFSSKETLHPLHPLHLDTKGHIQ